MNIRELVDMFLKHAENKKHKNNDQRKAYAYLLGLVGRYKEEPYQAKLAYPALEAGNGENIMEAVVGFIHNELEMDIGRDEIIKKIRKAFDDGLSYIIVLPEFRVGTYAVEEGMDMSPFLVQINWWVMREENKYGVEEEDLSELLYLRCGLVERK